MHRVLAAGLIVLFTPIGGAGAAVVSLRVALPSVGALGAISGASLAPLTAGPASLSLNSTLSPAAPSPSLVHSASLSPGPGLAPRIVSPAALAPNAEAAPLRAPLRELPKRLEPVRRAALRAAASDRLFDGTGDFPALDIPEHVKIEPIKGVKRMVREIREPAKLLQAKGIRATITVFGSARIPSEETARSNLEAVLKKHGPKPKAAADKRELAEARRALRMSKYYEEARKFGALVAKRAGGKVAVVTGGGPGIMEAANRGAFEAGGPSVGYNIQLEFEQSANPYLTPGLEFEFDNFAIRKMNLRHGAVGLVFFPGGFGTMDELFEIMTLMQTGKYPKIPIVLFGEKAYWAKILNFGAFDRMGLISHEDLDLFRFADTAEAAWDSIRERHAVP